MDHSVGRERGERRQQAPAQILTRLVEAFPFPGPDRNKPHLGVLADRPREFRPVRLNRLPQRWSISPAVSGVFHIERQSRVRWPRLPSTRCRGCPGPP